MIKSLILSLCLLPGIAFAGHGVQQVQQVQKVVVRQQRVGLFQRLRQRQQVQRVRVQRVQVQQFVAPQALYIPRQAFVAPYVAPQAFSAGCGQQVQQFNQHPQQLNQGGCAAFFKGH